MLFSERKAIEARFEGWCLKHKVSNCASNFLAWLQSEDPDGIATLKIVKKLKNENQQLMTDLRKRNVEHAR